MAKQVENVYGDALFELAIEQGRQEAFLEECTAISAAVTSNPELSVLVDHPGISGEAKLEVIDNVFKGRISDEVLGLLEMLADRGHFGKASEVLDYVCDRIKEYMHIGRASVVSAVELTDAQKDKVRERLLSTTPYEQFEVSYSVDPGLIGGMVIRIKDKVVDSSIHTQIANLSRELSKIQLKVGESAP